MGRTLHYELKENFTPTDEQENRLIKLSKTYNRRFNWTCENVWLSTLSYFPNWKHFPKEMNPKDVWKLIDDTSNQYLKRRLTEVETIKHLHADGLVLYSNKESLRGFTKTGGNEMNAHTVIAFVSEASKIIPSQIFSLYDEGDAHYCPLLIKNGKNLSNTTKIQSSTLFWR